MGLKLNLGSGQNPQEGYHNVDKYGAPDLRCDLEQFPWPWRDGSVSEILLNHVLEHLGATPDVFIRIVTEMYRVCEHGATILVVVPHPRHDHFLDDPTHVRAITPGLFHLFSKRINRIWQEQRGANSPLALYHDVDFEVVSTTSIPGEPYASQLRAGNLTEQDLMRDLSKYNNVATEIRITLKVIKA